MFKFLVAIFNHQLIKITNRLDCKQRPEKKKLTNFTLLLKSDNLILKHQFSINGKCKAISSRIALKLISITRELSECAKIPPKLCKLSNYYGNIMNRFSIHINFGAASILFRIFDAFNNNHLWSWLSKQDYQIMNI